MWLSVLPAGAFLFAGSVVSSLLLLDDSIACGLFCFLLVDSGAAGGLLASGKWCRLQRPKVNIIGPITKLITFSVATVCGASLAGPSINEGRA